MIDKLVCDLKTGKWGPQQSSGGVQTKIAATSVKLKDQREVGAFTPEEKERITSAIHRKYVEVASSALGKFKYETGKEGASARGYDRDILEEIPDNQLDSFCGVGNPFSICDIESGEDILDIGCGAGFDLIVARRKVGESGRVCGIDLTPEMISRAKQNFENLGIGDIETRHITSEILPFSGGSFDVVISNGAINLSSAKAELFKEIHRVLRPGGRLQFADIVIEGEVAPQEATSLESWSQWVGGVISVRDQIELMQKAGFSEVECIGKTGVRTSEHTVGAHFLAKRF